MRGAHGARARYLLVPDPRVTPYTRKAGILPHRGMVYLRNHLAVAIPARPFRHLPVPLGDLNRLVKIPGREGVRMEVAVHCLGHVFHREVVGGVAVVTRGDLPVAGLQPAVILLVHHVAVGARLRVVREIRTPARVDESEGSNT